MKEFETGAVRDTGGKGKMDLILWQGNEEVLVNKTTPLEVYGLTMKARYSFGDE